VRDADANATVAFNSVDGTMTFRTSAPDITLQIPTERELRNAGWRATNWDPYPSVGLAAGKWSDPGSTNGQLYMPSPSRFLQTTQSGNVDLSALREVYIASSITNFRTLQAGTGRMDYLARIPLEVNYGQVNTFRAYNHDAISVSDMHFGP
jgi:hypothetical protein